MAWDSAKRDEVTIITNPKAGHGRARRVLPSVLASFRKQLPKTRLRAVLTKSYEHTEELARSYVAKAQKRGEENATLVMMGGDGMAHLGVNACAGSSVRLGIIPAGTGDDFARGVGVPLDIAKSVQAIISGHTRRIDVIGVSQPHCDYTRCVGTILASGWDAKVNQRVNQAPFRAGPISYLASMALEIASWKPTRYRMRIDGHWRDVDGVLAAIANTSFYGGGIAIAPQANPSDGWLDITLVRRASRRRFISMLPSLANSTFIHSDVVETIKAREILLDGDGLIPMGDGEELTSTPLLVSCLPGALEVCVPENADHRTDDSR